MLKVKLLHPEAKAPKVAHPGEDLGYDLFSLEDVAIPPLQQRKIHTGIAVEFVPAAGWRLETKSSLADQYLSVEGGIGDAGYRGEVLVTLYNRHPDEYFGVLKGTKVAQLVKDPNRTENIEVVLELSDSSRGAAGFGSSGSV